jgi:hypothetical protein
MNKLSDTDLMSIVRDRSNAGMARYNFVLDDMTSDALKVVQKRVANMPWHESPQALSIPTGTKLTCILTRGDLVEGNTYTVYKSFPAVDPRYSVRSSSTVMLNEVVATKSNPKPDWKTDPDAVQKPDYTVHAVYDINLFKPYVAPDNKPKGFKDCLITIFGRFNGFRPPGWLV